MPLGALLRALWRRRLALLLATSLLYAAGAAGILLWPSAYLAQATVAPAETTGIATSSLLSPVPLIGGGGGLLDSGPAGNFAVYLGALRSPEAAALLARETPLLAGLAERRAAGLGGWVRRTFDLRLEADADDALDWLERNLAATQSLGSVTWTVTLSWPERAAALDMLRRLHAYAEGKVRADLAQLARGRIAAIGRRLGRESDVYLRNTLYDLLGQSQRVELVAEADEAVAARLVAAPAVELRPSLPNRPLLLVLLAVAAPMAVLLAAACLILAAAAEAPARLPEPVA
ncbi:hypothetical protein M0638_26745 [Roseomonas sp. NAR14]|uniref:Polysaccharide chain length determinant N-terminal domain-containing protein n=1 Tax=Roseomonas acroporae TaxID=2937791 RepID=A0A9X1YFK5_9PROT|nr:hypothetical protein [Roseomonas acroporae]MCK8787958.1 hypothetical protein [Roseomonas acroporae]